MSSGAYVALSGLQARAAQLERLASDLANVGTSGYKAERGTTAAAERDVDAFARALRSAVDVADGPRAVDFRPGAITTTGRDLDLAIDGRGFFAVETPEGVRYTRNGHFTRRADGVLSTEQGFPVLGDTGPLTLPSGGGAVTVGDDGQIRVGQTPVGRPRIVDFDNYDQLGRQEGAMFRPAASVTVGAAGDARLVTGALEQSNVGLVERMAQMTEVTRTFEALQRGVTILMNDLDGRAINDLGSAVGEAGFSRFIRFIGFTGRRGSGLESPTPINRPARIRLDGAGISWTNGHETRDSNGAQTMIRALYTAASGMSAQQSNIDTVAHNLANVNTTGFKKSHMEFEDLVYQQVRVPGSPTSTSTEAPVGLETGLGTKPVSTARDFSTGNLRSTSAPLDLAIEGRGFFQIARPDGTTAYTRAGSLHLDGEGRIVTAEGYALEPEMTIPENALAISISRAGVVSVNIAGQSAAQEVGTIELASFQNPAGLLALGGNLFTTTTASGEPITGIPGTDGIGTITQGFLEESNVSVVEEMIAMILGQRAYEANSRVVKAADEMLAQVNNMAR